MMLSLLHRGGRWPRRARAKSLAGRSGGGRRLRLPGLLGDADAALGGDLGGRVGVRVGQAETRVRVDDLPVGGGLPLLVGAARARAPVDSGAGAVAAPERQAAALGPQALVGGLR